jgi:cytochrome c553
MRGTGVLQLVLGLIGFVAVEGCEHRERAVRVTNAVPDTNPQLEIAAAVLRETGTQDSSVKRGQSVVMGTSPCTTGGTCFSCFQCHGVRGEGGATAALPRLAGQDHRYLDLTLQEFANGQRQSATMHEVARALTEQQRQDVALYYSVVTAPAPLRPASKSDASAQTGLAIDEHGLPEAGVPACVTCHSPEQRAKAAQYPYVSGQYADYLEQQLEHFRAGTRRGANAQIMQVIARPLTPEQSRAVAEYFASQPPPQTSAQQAQR